MTYLVLEIPEEGLYGYLAKVQDALVALAVQNAGGNLARAAEQLKVSRNTLVYSLLRQSPRANWTRRAGRQVMKGRARGERR